MHLKLSYLFLLTIVCCLWAGFWVKIVWLVPSLSHSPVSSQPWLICMLSYLFKVLLTWFKRCNKLLQLLEVLRNISIWRFILGRLSSFFDDKSGIVPAVSLLQIISVVKFLWNYSKSQNTSTDKCSRLSFPSPEYTLFCFTLYIPKPWLFHSLYEYFCFFTHFFVSMVLYLVCICLQFYRKPLELWHKFRSPLCNW